MSVSCWWWVACGLQCGLQWTLAPKLKQPQSNWEVENRQRLGGSVSCMRDSDPSPFQSSREFVSTKRDYAIKFAVSLWSKSFWSKSLLIDLRDFQTSSFYASPIFSYLVFPREEFHHRPIAPLSAAGFKCAGRWRRWSGASLKRTSSYT